MASWFNTVTSLADDLVTGFLDENNNTSSTSTPSHEYDEYTQTWLDAEGEKSTDNPLIEGSLSTGDLRFTHMMDCGNFSDAAMSHELKVRGKTYIDDRVKVQSPGAVSTLVGFEIFEVDIEDGAHTSGSGNSSRYDHIASKGLMKQRIEAVKRLQDPPFLFILNFQIPGDPPVSLVATFALPRNMTEPLQDDTDDMRAFKHLWSQYIDLPRTEDERLSKWEDATCDSQKVEAKSPPTGMLQAWGGPADISWPDPSEPGSLPYDDFRHSRFKLIPAMKNAPWVVLAAVRNVPVILGHKLVQRYFRGDNYIETDVDVASSVIALNIVALCRNYAKHIDVECAVVLQGESEHELPEKILAAISLPFIDIEKRRTLFMN
mmetsp:Transcript_13012/g.19629  ORF Transcript_13012/g.19629 Transcript_13012/m.19629 type:complete len:375 (+) Transcript_13012:187-1311(+)|eukprot:CAMPEP_0185036766 /NCGR_PEP_ID=MMETSP1103-20130426/30219_1 /TAXON_ID=36769 /ORGANISM="Paraphysomonas bandaiensis, Strain Caron Lab Isolate" /LENGTH=374 /DNA_ID=CAMNT_0027574439 /DNA_START=112 /DNA_END=1236 /DNA_ORIENTATION=+